jgi:hypothetical protein
MPHGYTPQQVYWSLEHNLLEPSGRVADGWFEHEDKAHETMKFEEKSVLPALIRIPKFMAVDRPRNISFANYGETTPDGLHVKDSADIDGAYFNITVDDRLNGGGLRLKGRRDYLYLTMVRVTSRIRQSLKRIMPID